MNILDAQRNELNLNDEVVIAVPRYNTLLDMQKGIVKEVSSKNVVIECYENFSLTNSKIVKFKNTPTEEINMTYRVLKI